MTYAQTFLQNNLQVQKIDVSLQCLKIVVIYFAGQRLIAQKYLGFFYAL